MSSEKDLHKLFDVAVKRLTSIIEDGVQVVVGLGEKAQVEMIDPPASYFTAAAAYLKNYDVRTTPEENSELALLKRTLAEKRARPALSMGELADFTEKRLQ
jgi:hypothetical protein